MKASETTEKLRMLTSMIEVVTVARMLLEYYTQNPKIYARLEVEERAILDQLVECLGNLAGVEKE